MKFKERGNRTKGNGSRQQKSRQQADCAGCGGELKRIRCLGLYDRAAGGRFIYALCDDCADELERHPEVVAERAEARIERMVV